MPRHNKQPKIVRQLPSQAGCSNKKRYVSRAQALAVIADRSNLIADDTQLDTYRCPNCQGWHLTSVK